MRKGKEECRIVRSKSSFQGTEANPLGIRRGTITRNGKSIEGPDRERGVVFQQPTLYPWLNVQKNVEFGLKMRKLPREERRKNTKRCRSGCRSLSRPTLTSSPAA